MISINQQILLNGRYHSGSTAIFTLQNRAFQFGDCISETIHTCASRLCFFDEHMQVLRTAMDLAGMEIPAKFSSEIAEWKSEISKMLVKNKIFKGANVKIMVFRADSDSFVTLNDKVDCLVTAEPLAQTGFEFNKNGLAISVFEKMKKVYDDFAIYNTHQHTLLRSLAVKTALKERLNDFILLNQDGKIVETAVHGNIFIVKDKVVYTPPLSDGATNDIIRFKVLQTAGELGLGTSCDSSISQELALQADEIFVASTENGVNWVRAFQNRRFYHTISSAIHQKINELYLNSEE